MLLYLLISIFISVSNQARPTCNGAEFTNVYLEYRQNNMLNELYQLNTFGGNFNNKCQDLTSNPRSKYIDILNKNNIKCEGKWCVNNIFSCPNQTKECYEVEHIVDQKNTPFNSCNRYILGNLIMAYGKWNYEVGQPCWDSIKMEKMNVYGKTIFCSAIKNIIECDPKCHIPIPPECTDSLEPNNASNVILIFIIVSVCIMCIISLIVKYNSSIREMLVNKCDWINKYNNI
jgi:hypothetical protein